MSRSSEYGFIFKPRCCQKCSAGPHNDNKHEDDCLINVYEFGDDKDPAAAQAFRKAWLAGYNDQRPTDGFFQSMLAYHMGSRMRTRRTGLPPSTPSSVFADMLMGRPA